MKVKELAEIFKVSSSELLKILPNVGVDVTLGDETMVDKNIEKQQEMCYTYSEIVQTERRIPWKTNGSNRFISVRSVRIPCTDDSTFMMTDVKFYGLFKGTETFFSEIPCIVWNPAACILFRRSCFTTPIPRFRRTIFGANWSFRGIRSGTY